MMATNQKGAKQKRPIVTQTAIDQARAIVAEKYGDDLANNLSEGDVISLALSIVSEEQGS